MGNTYQIKVIKSDTGEPVAWLDPWAGTKATTDYDVYGKHGIPLYPHHQQLTQAQVGAREPLTSAQIGQDPIFRAGVRFAEQHHGIKGGQHVVE